MKNYHKYLNISEIETRWNFYITTVGYSKTDKNIHYPNTEQHPHDHGFSWNKGRILDGFYLVFIPFGRGYFESVDSPISEVDAGTCFILFPGKWHRYKPDPEIGWEEYWVGFKGDYPTYLMQEYFDQKNPVIRTGVNKEFLTLFTQLLSSVSQAQIGYPQAITGITLQIIAQLNRLKLMEKIQDDAESIWISQTIFLLQHQLNDNINIEKLAEKFPISYSKFRKLFKLHTGKSPNQYHLDLRLNKAKELLQESNMNIQEVGYQTGFESPYYFSRLFKKKYGYPPKFFRNQVKDTHPEQ